MDFILIIISGILYIIPFLQPNLFFISWFAFVPFLYVIYNSNYKKIFYKSWLLGLIIMLGVGYPIFYSIKNFSNLPSFPISLLVFISFAILSLIYGLWGKLYKLIQSKNSFNPFLFSLTWLALELVRHLILNFFPLGYLGYTQANFNHIIQVADIGGVFLVGFIIILINALIFKFLITKEPRYIYISILVIILVLSYGFYQIDRYENLEASIKVGIIQTNINQGEKWLDSNIEKYNDLFISEKQVFDDVNLIITPETALTFDMNKDFRYREKILNKIDDIDKYYQVGSLSTKDNSNKNYNSSYLISPEGEILSRYDKNKLVLFGEYVVFSDLIEKITGSRINSLLSGNEINKFETPFAKWKTVICSEILYPRYVAKNNKDIDFIVNQSNEAWFDNSKNLKNQMYASLIFRAVENRKSIVKVGNRAYGGIVYPNGKYLKYMDNLTKIIDVDTRKSSN